MSQIETSPVHWTDQGKRLEIHGIGRPLANVRYVMLTGVNFKNPAFARTLFSRYTAPKPPSVEAVLSRTESGFIARAPELDALGFGDTIEGALADLRDEIRDYLRTVRDDGLALAPQIEHHAEHLGLLTVDPKMWFSAVRLPEPIDAADLA